jgi:uncharacterized protein
VRRRDKEITDKSSIENILKEADVCRIALSSENLPYIIPMNFALYGNSIYLHSATEGKKITMLNSNKNVCFEVESDVAISRAEKPCNWGMKYLCVVGMGKAFIVEDENEKREALTLIAKKYSGEPVDLSADYNHEKIAVIRVDITELSGKKSGY